MEFTRSSKVQGTTAHKDVSMRKPGPTEFDAREEEDMSAYVKGFRVRTHGFYMLLWPGLLLCVHVSVHPVQLCAC